MTSLFSKRYKYIFVDETNFISIFIICVTRRQTKFCSLNSLAHSPLKLQPGNY